jgi:hypothetical protein
MNINIKESLEQNGMSKMERMIFTIRELQNFYLKELEESKKNLENLYNVITATDTRNNPKS